MKKISKSDLRGLTERFPVMGSDVQRGVVGGVTQEEFDNWSGVWPGGYVDGIGYVGPEVVVTAGTYSYSYIYESYGWNEYSWNQMNYNSSYGSNSYSSSTSFPDFGVESYNTMYRSGFEQGYSIGQNGGVLSGVYAHVYSFISAAVAGNEIGSVQYEMIYYSKGIRDGYSKAREIYGN